MQLSDLMEAGRKSDFTTVSGLFVARGMLRPTGEKKWEVILKTG